MSLSTSILNNFKSEWINDALTAEMGLFIGILRLYLSGLGGVPLGTKREADFLCSIAGDLFKRCFERAGFRADCFWEVHGKNQPQQIILSLRFFGYI